MEKEKQIQIPESLFYRLTNYFDSLDWETLHKNNAEQFHQALAIQEGLTKKSIAIADRNNYRKQYTMNSGGVTK